MFKWFNEADNGQWLTVLDNADDLDTFFAKPTSTGADSERTMPLIDYLPQSSRGLMLITTRDTRMSRRLAGRDTSIAVEAMLPSERRKTYCDLDRRDLVATMMTTQEYLSTN